MVGRQLTHYEIVEPLGEGGMGEVYRARDTRLGRAVAVKVLPPAVASDAARVARFEREARLLASLDHPHIAGIYGLEEADGVRFIAMELVEGETLERRLARGALPVEEALECCRQVAAALEAAHGQGIVHRDLKPANVILTPKGHVKVLDFGLAIAVESTRVAAEAAGAGGTADTEAAAREADAGESGEGAADAEDPTLLTTPGTMLGTAPYMSPEQARGEPADRRCDIWAFGCLMYEALSGERAFQGRTVADTLAAILGREPDWGALPPGVPATAVALLRRCLRKDPDRRLHDIADARIEVDEALEELRAEGSTVREGGPGVPRKGPDPRRRDRPWGWAIGGLLAGLVAASLILYAALPAGRNAADPAPSGEVLRFVVPLSEGMTLWTPPGGLASPSMSISPDGSRIAFVGVRDGVRRLYLRSVDRFEAEPLSGTEDAGSPFFSPDGEWIAFVAEGGLKRVHVDGGTPLTICDVRGLAGDVQGFDGGDWGAADVIVFASGGRLWRVPAGGGTPEPVAVPSETDTGYAWPELLPTGEVVLATIRSGGDLDEHRIVAVPIEGGDPRVVIEDARFSRYLASGHLVYLRQGRLYAVGFDPGRADAVGPAVRILEEVHASVGGAASLATSTTGTLLFVAGRGQGTSELVLVDREGREEPLAVPPDYEFPRFAPDGERLALTSVADEGMAVWTYDLGRRALSRVTVEGSSHLLMWTPDGRNLVFSSTAAGPSNLFWRPADHSGPAEQLVSSQFHQDPSSWAPDGSALLFQELRPGEHWDLWLLPLEGDRVARPLLDSPHSERQAEFSPDGRWIAFVSDESGRAEVYVQPFPGPGPPQQISTAGGTDPLWAPGGEALYYLVDEGLMAVDTDLGPPFVAGRPRLLLEGSFVRDIGGRTNYDVAPDGRRFVMVKRSERSTVTELRVVVNWFGELERTVPGAAGEPSGT